MRAGVPGVELERHNKAETKTKRVFRCLRYHPKLGGEKR
jgi:hypothetical protein